jgi:hypothetical protein
MGCHKTEKKQYAQQTSCVCATDLQVFNNYTWFNVSEVTFTGEIAGQRNMLLFKDPEFCQKPQKANLEKSVQLKMKNGELDTEWSAKCSTLDRKGKERVGQFTELSSGIFVCSYTPESMVSGFPRTGTPRNNVDAADCLLSDLHNCSPDVPDKCVLSTSG